MRIKDSGEVQALFFALLANTNAGLADEDFEFESYKELAPVGVGSG